MIDDILNNNNFETIEILKALSVAHRYLGELKGLCQSMPNPAILIDSLSLQEAKDSSEIENIITTQDEIYKYRLQPNLINAATKEVENYIDSLNFFQQKLAENNLITVRTITDAQKIIKDNDAGVRVQIGTVLKNERTQKTIYIPPEPSKLPKLLADLEKFINTKDELDPLIKMAIIHHQFESIHPFYDGNGRIGRIINIIYLMQQKLLDIPVLYLSRYINHNKSRYYALLQSVRDENAWQDWTVFMLNGVAKTAKNSLILVNDIRVLQQEYKKKIRNKCPKIYSQELINNLFKHPYTKISFLQEDLGASRVTAGRYLAELTQEGLLTKRKLGRENYYLNHQLIDLLSNIENMKEREAS
ncbi:MloA protein, putative [uncultured Candidatus Thioglobus sp.]|nr:MloA protein, putative [uncultured Candidatus Thioglobus sp.]